MNKCKCGCGQVVKNQYVLGHNRKGIKALESTKLKHRLLMLGDNNPMRNPATRAKMVKGVTGKPKRKPLLKQFICGECGISFEASGHSHRKFCEACGSENSTQTRHRETPQYKEVRLRWNHSPSGRAAMAESGMKRRNHSTNPKTYAKRIKQLHELKEACNICNCPYTLKHQVDHIIPLSFGGTDEWDNLQPICYKCHADKTRKENLSRGSKRCLIPKRHG